MSNIATDLQPFAVPLSELETHPENAKLGNVEAIKESLERFGQVRPIVVQRSTSYVVAGNHTMKAVRELGWDTIAAVRIDMDDDEALAYLTADNRTGELGGYNDEQLAKNLEKLMLTGKLLGTGYTPDDVDDLLASMDAMPEVDPGEFEGTNAVSDEQLAERFKNRSQVALRQFVLMYEQDTATEVEGMFRTLERAWGMSGARDVVLEALRRAVAQPPVEGLSPEERARADAPVAEVQEPSVPEVDPTVDVPEVPPPFQPARMPVEPDDDPPPFTPEPEDDDEDTLGNVVIVDAGGAPVANEDGHPQPGDAEAAAAVDDAMARESS